MENNVGFFSYQSSILSEMVGMRVSAMFSFDKMCIFVFCSAINYMALVPFHQSILISFSLSI